MLSLAYLVKQHIVNVKNRVRFPETPKKWLIVQRIRMLCYERRDESSNLSKPTKWMNSLMEKQFPSKE